VSKHLDDPQHAQFCVTQAAKQVHEGRSADYPLGTIGPDQDLLAEGAYGSDRLARLGVQAVIRPIARRSAPPPLDSDLLNSK